MKEALEQELIDLATGIIANRGNLDLEALGKEAQRIVEKITILNFVEKYYQTMRASEERVMYAMRKVALFINENKEDILNLGEAVEAKPLPSLEPKKEETEKPAFVAMEPQPVVAAKEEPAAETEPEPAFVAMEPKPIVASEPEPIITDILVDAEPITAAAEPAPEPIHAGEPVHTHTPEPIHAAEPVHTHTPEPIHVAEPVHTHTPEPIHAAEPVHTHTPEPIHVSEPVHTHTPEPVHVAEPVHVSEPVDAPAPEPASVENNQDVIATTEDWNDWNNWQTHLNDAQQYPEDTLAEVPVHTSEPVRVSEPLQEVTSINTQQPMRESTYTAPDWAVSIEQPVAPAQPAPIAAPEAVSTPEPVQQQTTQEQEILKQTPSLEEFLAKSKAAAFDKKDPEEPKPVQSLNDRFSKEMQIGLNDKLAFIQKLFFGSESEYNRVLKHIEGLHTLEEAVQYIQQQVKPTYTNWKGKEEYEERFLHFVLRKFE